MICPFGTGTGSMSALGHLLQVRSRPLVHKCPLCINTDRKFWALGFVAMCQKRHRTLGLK